MSTKNALRVRRARAKLRAQGLRPIQIWVPDTRAPGFAEEAARQAELLRGSASEKEAMDFIEAAFEWPEP